MHATVKALKNLKSPDQFAGKRSMQTGDVGHISKTTILGAKRRASMSPPPPPGGAPAGGAPAAPAEGGSA